MVVASFLTLLLASTEATQVQTLRDAEQAFAQGMQARARPQEARRHFRAAAEHLVQLRQQGASHPLLHGNEGNAWLLAGEIPQAILAYQRGLRLAPTDRRLRAGLDNAREQVVFAAGGTLGRPVASTVPDWLPRLQLTPASVLLLALGYTAGLVLLTRARTNARFATLGWGLTFLLLTMAFAALIAYSTWKNQQTGRPLVVIATNDLPLRTGNGLAYPLRGEGMLNRGVEARLLFSRGDWLQIELPGGEVGWIPAQAALVEETPASSATDRD